MFARLMGLKAISPAALHELMQREAVSMVCRRNRQRKAVGDQ
jgi:hypothetical protein